MKIDYNINHIMSHNVPGISDVPVPLGLAESLPLYFLLPEIASFVTEGMSRRVGLLFSLTAIPCYMLYWFIEAKNISLSSNC